jgi:hypothetical protein
MLDLVSNKKNILIISGLLAYKPFVNVGKNKPYVHFLLAQKMTDKDSFRYLKLISFEPTVIKQLEKMTTQAIVEINGHLSIVSKDNDLNYLLVCDSIVPVVIYNIPLKSKGGIHIEEYSNDKIASQEVAATINVISEDEIEVLQNQMKSLK